MTTLQLCTYDIARYTNGKGAHDPVNLVGPPHMDAFVLEEVELIAGTGF